MNYPKVCHENVWLVQAITTQAITHEENIVKALFIGVKESVKAVCAKAFGNGRDRLTINFTNRDPVILQNAAAKVAYRPIAGSPYIIGSLSHPDSIANMVSGQDKHTIYAQAFTIFKRHLDLPIIYEWVPVFWRIALEHGFAMPLNTYGTTHSCWHLNISSSEDFIARVEDRLSELHHIANKIAI